MKQLWTALLCTTLFSAAAAAGGNACEPSGTAGAALDRAEHLAEQCGGAPACLAEWRQALETARRRHPRDVFVHRAYQDMALRGPEPEPANLAKEYVDLATAHPESAFFLYFAGRSTPDEPAERDFYERAVAADPAFPWAQLGLAAALDSEDPRRSRELALAFARLCPARIDMSTRITALEGKEDMAAIADAARHAIAGRKDRGVLPLYSALWAAEFRATPPAGFDAARERVRADLALLAGLGFADELAYWRTLEAGADLTDDQEAVRQARDARWRIAPCASDTMSFLRKRLEEENPMPGPEPASGRLAWYQKRYQTARDWTTTCPNLVPGWKVRLEAALELPELSTEQVLAEIDAALPVFDSTPGTSLAFSASLLAALEYVERGVRLEQVPRLAERARTEIEERFRRFTAYRGLSEEMLQGAESMRWSAAWNSRVVEARASLATGSLAEARWTLATLAGLHAAFVPRDDADGYSKFLARTSSWTLWELKGRLAEAEKRDLDALALYGKALGFATEKEDLLGRAKAVWGRLGGGEEGWAAFSSPAEQRAVAEGPASRWQEKSQALADFSLVDVTGRTWTLADLKGKRALINFWATWCIPCHRELPHLQKLHDQLAGDPDALVLTVSIDENPGLVAPFTAKRGLTLPTLLGYEFYKQMAADGAVPRNWLIDDRGVLRLEQLGFDPDSVEPWFEDLLARLRDGRGLEAPGR